VCWGVPARVLEVEGFEAVVDFGGGVRRRVLLLVDAAPGDYVVVHAGSAIGKVKPEEALEILLALKEVAESLSPEAAEALGKAIEELRSSLAGAAPSKAAGGSH
jgi:hydrogenase expression/formation protein HypC